MGWLTMVGVIAEAGENGTVETKEKKQLFLGEWSEIISKSVCSPECTPDFSCNPPPNCGPDKCCPDH